MEYFSTIEKAVYLIGIKRTKDAVSILKDVITNYPEAAHPHSLLSLCYADSKQHKAAIEEAKLAISMEPDSSFPHYALAYAHFSREKFSQAEYAIRQALAIDPDIDSYIHILAASLFNQGMYKECMNAVQHGLQINPNNNDLLTLKSLLYTNKGDLKRADEFINKSLYEDPENTIALARKGWLDLDKGSYKSAQTTFLSALSKDPMNEAAREGLLEVYKLKSKVFNFFISKSFRTFYFEFRWYTIFLILIFIKTLPIWFFLLSVYLLAGWYLSVLFNYILRFGEKTKYLITDRQKKQSDVFIIINLVVGVLTVIAGIKESHMLWKVVFILLAVLFIAIGTLEIEVKKDKWMSIGWGVLLIGILFLMFSYSLYIVAIASVFVICTYGLGWSVRFVRTSD
ncbi:hypothetical protein Hsw_0697 [Sporocytophaga myxococcoides]|uniref:Uncharacterized protein n=1 Tax=Sporocytophaga myxococcoides TaxID=153721 RepID=A0A098LJF6_9BACT|nr:hypothetical protein [Sporocytophaga myxococcoides]GAL86542.1 hypothetical protein Hsw_0697 [Sporocytophaga myxococcoides]